MRIPFVFLLVACLLTGCGVPTRVYHGVKVSKLRSSAIPLEQLETRVEIRENQSWRFRSRAAEPVVIVARIPAESESSPSSSIWHRGDRLSLNHRQVIESVFCQHLLAKGYDAASRMDLGASIREVDLLEEYGSHPVSLRLLGGRHLLIVTVTEFVFEESSYRRESHYTADRNYPVGTRIRLHVTASLNTTETTGVAWVATAAADAVLAGSPSPQAALERVIQQLAERVPAVAADARRL